MTEIISLSASNESLNLNDFIVQKKLGRGSFGKVYKVKEKKTGKNYAAKVSIETIDDYSSDIFANLSREVNIISKLNHPSVLHFKGYSSIDFKKRQKPVIITELVSNGSLQDLIQRESNNQSIWNSTRKLIIIYGITSAMSYLHKHNIIHRDLKPENILIDKFMLPKIADFGLSKIKHTNIDSMTSNSVTRDIKGTPIFMAPEIFRNAEYSKASDAYSFSIIVYEMMTNQKPFDNLNFFQIVSKLFPMLDLIVI